MTIEYIFSKIIKKFLRGKCVINSKIHRSAVINSGCNVVNSSMDKYSYIGYDSTLVNCNMGAYCSVADGVIIGGAEHPMNWVSMSPVFQNVRHSGPVKRFAKFDLPDTKITTIGNDVWIGNRAIIKQGVSIGDGAVVGAGAVVTKNVEPYSIVVGSPAKHIKYRFNEKIREDLLKTAWWTLSDQELLEISKYIKNPEEFIEKTKK
jgi:acetyltransferase-like isoleucine patch superfamily enzyme